MPPKSKKGKTISLTAFQGNAQPERADDYDWAEDDWVPEVDEEGKDLTLEQRKAYAQMRYNHNSTKLGTEMGFREAPQSRLSKMVDEGMQPPYVAHIGNLQTGITEEEVKDIFAVETIVRVKLVTRERAVFAFVEFNTVNALHHAILRDGEIIKKRAMRVDVATPEQIERMSRGQQTRGGPAMSRDSMGAKVSSTNALDRDTFGEQQPVAQPLRFGGMSGKMKSSGSFGELSRDTIGVSQQKPADFGAWRDAPQEAQPERQPGLGLRENRRSDEGVDRPRGGRKADAPSGGSAFSAMGNWRDEVSEPQPTMSPNSSDSGKRVDGPRRNQGPTKILAKPSPPADNGSRWGDLRKE